MREKNWMTVEFSSRIENVAFARVAVASFAAQLDFTLDDLEEIKVVVSEAVTNSIVHGYDGSPHHTVRVTVVLEQNAVEIVVEDSGKGIEDVKKAMEPAYTTDPERMGLGFVFMQSFSDFLEVSSGPGRGTRVKMVKKVSPAGKAAEGSC